MASNKVVKDAIKISEKENKENFERPSETLENCYKKVWLIGTKI